MTYNHRQIESKWQKHWQEHNAFAPSSDPTKTKYYVLDMFPYPSGAGLHVGHLVGYTATDIVARYKRQKGYNVLHPMGWDSFGLPAEQYAIRTGTHPAETTKKNIDNFRHQLHALGFSYDWTRELATSDPNYYKWTQWIFTKLYECGLAYEAELLVNFCPALGTVLANEEVENGRSKEGGHPVERRPLRQWVLKITDYAERLLDDLALLDWPAGLKKLQANWIGKSEGAKIFFLIEGHDETIVTYTTCPDTLFGTTFLVLAPEHPLVSSITTEECREAVESYKKASSAKSDLDRTDLNKEKSGVFTGGYATNPANGRVIPIWISDYVLMSYGTGAIMAVPSHDERDFAFAKKHGLKIVAVYDPDLQEHPEALEDGADAEELRQDILKGLCCWPYGGTAINSDNGILTLDGLDTAAAKEATIQWLEKEGKGKRTTAYKLRDWLFSRQRYWGEPFPILHYSDGSKRTLDLEELPLCPPQLHDFKPTDDGQSPLSRSKEWVEVVDSKRGERALRETNVMPQWAGSCWYYLRFIDPHNDKEAWDKALEKYWMPVDLYVGGAEHAVLHLLYARFWHKVLYDLKLVSTSEPFQKLCNQGMVVAKSYKRANGLYVAPDEVLERDGHDLHAGDGEILSSQIEKMSKSKLNGVTPDDVIEEYGADSLRLYGMFMGPLEKEKIWNTDAVSGCRRFLNRFWEMATSPKVKEVELLEGDKLGHRLVYGVSKDIEALQFNTAIAKMMEFINDFTKLPFYPKKVVRMAVQCLMPFAPHISEELWQRLGYGGELLSHTPYPTVDKALLEEEEVEYVIQVNGKVRGRFTLAKGQTQEAVLAKTKEHDLARRYLDGKDIEKVIFVPNKLLNVVVK